MEKDLQQIDYMNKQIQFLTSILIKLKRKHGIGIYCCKDAENSLGWNHNGKCKNWTLTY